LTLLTDGESLDGLPDPLEEFFGVATGAILADEGEAILAAGAVALDGVCVLDEVADGLDKAGVTAAEEEEDLPVGVPFAEEVVLDAGAGFA